mmetsp:Transcript_25856/g.63628  ORF Transcript_25856/g.63628 Transcript_25856/m.63628 type:complete len:217 (-) Transcript_25856:385-1035(-)
MRYCYRTPSLSSHPPVHEHLPVAVRHDPELVVHVAHVRGGGGRAPLVPRQQLPHRTHGVVAVQEPGQEQRGLGDALGALHPGPHQLQVHPARGGVQRHLLGERHHAAAERGQQLEPAEDRDDGEGEQDGVEVRLHGAVLEVDGLCDASHRAGAPALDLQLVQAEEHLGRLALAEHGVPERILNSHEEGRRPEQLLGRQHQLPVSVEQRRVCHGTAR